MTGYFLNKAGDKCVSKCDDGTYGDADTSTCMDCDAKCAKCTKSGSCTECKDSKYVKGNECVATCTDIGYTKQEVPVKACFQAIQNCSTLAYPCTQCNNDNYLYDDGLQCISQCNPVGNFVSN
jgi:hypothetical protein